MKVDSPQGDEQFARYYQLRWQVLRAPWNQPRGSECDELEEAAEHAVIWDQDGAAVAVGRLHLNAPDEAQIRYMAVAPHLRGRGLGQAIVEHLERIARQRGAARIVLNARAEIADFYSRLGYETVGAGPTLFETVAHVRMSKALT